MNILLWALRILLAFWNAVGGAFMIHNYQKVGAKWALNTLPAPVWIGIGVLQILFALGLILPGMKFRKPASIAAACLAALSLLGVALYTQYHGFPGILWGVIPALLEAYVAYKRWPDSKS